MNRAWDTQVALTEPTYVGPDKTAFDDVTVQAGAMGQAGWKTCQVGL